MTRQERLLGAAGFLGLALAAVGHYLLGVRELTAAGFPLALVALVWLAVLARRPPER